MKKLKGFVLLMFCCLFSGVIALSACSPSDDTSSTSSSVDSSSTIDSSASDSSSSSSSDASSSSGDSSSVDSSSVDDSSSSDSSSTESDETNYDPMLESITVDASGAKTSYALGEEFSSDGIVVKAQTTINFITQDSITLAATDYTVDSSNFDSSKVGTYTIYVTYALPANPQAFQSAEYTVTVSSSLPTYANMQITYTGSQQLTYSTSGVTINLSSSLLTVTSYVGNDASNLTESTVTDYTLYYSVNGSTEKTVNNSQITATEAGVYSIYAVKDYVSGTESIEMRAQLLIFVVDTAETLEKDSGGTTSYSYGASNIGSDWTYTLTFASGKTESLDYSDVEITADGNTSGSQTAVATYTYTYTGIQNGEVTSVSKNLTVNVDITVAAAVFGTTVGFLTAALSSVDDFTAVSYSAGDTIATNDVFTLTSTVATKTSIGTMSSSDGGASALLQVVKADGSKAFSYTDMDSNTIAPDQGIKMSNTIASGSDSGTVFTLTATKNCKVQLYLVLANDGYNSDRTGTIYYAVDGGTAVSTDVSKRTTVTTISVTLTAGQKLTIGATNTHSSTAKLWLFGAQAQELS